MAKFTSILFLLTCFNASIFAQKTEINFSKEIAKLNVIGQQIITSEDNKVKSKECLKYKAGLQDLLQNNESFEYNFDSLKTISILKANNLKIYNWALPLTDGSFNYFALLQIRKSKNEFNVVDLTDKSDNIKTPENKILTSKNWYGALYYKIIYDKKLGKNYYTVLGWDGNNKLTNKKIIDVIYISNDRMVKFGAPIFKTKKKTKKRVIFEYSENAVMSLEYHNGVEQIVFDFLVPASSKLKGVYEYYGPSLNRFDAFTIDSGEWVYNEDIDIELDRNMKDFFWKDPKGK